jgi:transposase
VLAFPPSTRIFLCNQPVDMRLSFDGLESMIKTQFGANTLCGHLFVFFSKRRDRMKIIFWDLDGFALYYKRLEKGTFSWIADVDLGPEKEIRASEFALILAGINPKEVKRSKRLERTEGLHFHH